MKNIYVIPILIILNLTKIKEYINKLGYIENKLGYKDNIYLRDVKTELNDIKDISNKLSKYSLLNIKFVDWDSLSVSEVLCD